jgi:hypothetical protein
LYFPSTSENRITLDGLFWGDPIEISDATGYSVTEVTYNLGSYSIVETGRNSNGEWIKFSNGLLIMYGYATLPGQALSILAQGYWTFPVQPYNPQDSNINFSVVVENGNGYAGDIGLQAMNGVYSAISSTTAILKSYSYRNVIQYPVVYRIHFIGRWQ